MGRLFPILFLADLALMVFALIDCLSTDNIEVRALPKPFWVMLILLFSPVGPIVWFVAGRPQSAATAPTGRWTPGKGFTASNRPRPVAPDDDPEFLRGLAKERRDDESLLREWEADLRRREEELRRRKGGDQPSDDT